MDRPQFQYLRASRDRRLRAVALLKEMRRNSEIASERAREKRLMDRLDGLIAKWKDRP